MVCRSWRRAWRGNRPSPLHPTIELRRLHARASSRWRRPLHTTRSHRKRQSHPSHDPHQRRIYSLFLVAFGQTYLATVALYARQAVIVAYMVGRSSLGPSVLGGHGGIRDRSRERGRHRDQCSSSISSVSLSRPGSSGASSVRGADGGSVQLRGLPGCSASPSAWASVSVTRRPCSPARRLVSTPSSASSYCRPRPSPPPTPARSSESCVALQDLIATSSCSCSRATARAGACGSRSGCSSSSCCPRSCFVTSISWNRFVLERSIARFDQIHEYVSCSRSAGVRHCRVAHVAGLSHEIGAFIAGRDAGAEPHRPVHRREPETGAGFFHDRFSFRSARVAESPARGRRAGPGAPPSPWRCSPWGRG